MKRKLLINKINREILKYTFFFLIMLNYTRHSFIFHDIVLEKKEFRLISYSCIILKL